MSAGGSHVSSCGGGPYHSLSATQPRSNRAGTGGGGARRGTAAGTRSSSAEALAAAAASDAAVVAALAVGKHLQLNDLTSAAHCSRAVASSPAAAPWASAEGGGAAGGGGGDKERARGGARSLVTGCPWRQAAPCIVAAGHARGGPLGGGMLALQTRQLYQVNKFYGEKVAARRAELAVTVREVVAVVQSVLKEVEAHEPRFVSSLTETETGRYEGLIVNSPTEFEVLLQLNQMSIFNFVDDGAVPGCAVLRLSDGRKRSMSLWVEFITASGYLSARKIRSRFQTLVAQSLDKCHFRDVVRMVADTSDVKLRIRERYVVQITPAFKCTGAALWPPSASGHWPPATQTQQAWPSPALVAEVKVEGYHLLSKDSAYMKDKQNSSEGDSWVMSFIDAEERLLRGHGRRKVLSVLRCLRERHLSGSPSGATAALPVVAMPSQLTSVVQDAHIRALLLYECEKHPRDSDWSELMLGDRIHAVLLQLVSCLQNRRCPHYFLSSVDLFRGASAAAMDAAAKAVWHILREMLTNSRCLDNL